MKFKRLYIFLFSAVFFYSCANQIPPSGGEDDKTPPEILKIIPKPNSLNIKGNSVLILFNEYVDRRSFEESFSISPKLKGETVFNWSGKEVVAEFSGQFEKNRTYVITISRDLKDVRGNNPISSSLSFAFSTGTKLDKGIISGRVISDKKDRIKIFAYITDDKPGNKIDPEKNIPDYITQPSENGKYLFTNLPEATFRLFAVTDEDRNSLYDKEFEMISVLHNDIKLSKDSIQFENENFILKNFGFDKTSGEFLKLLTPYSNGLINTNISPATGSIPDDYRFYFNFKTRNFSKEEIVNNLMIKDTSTGKSYKLVYNWLNDSLLEIFSTEKFSYSSDIRISLDLNETDSKIYFSENLRVTDKSKSGTLSGKISDDTGISYPVYVILLNNGNKFISYNRKLTDTKDFKFDDVIEGSYTLFSYIDKNENGSFDNGIYFPFTGSEKFYVFENEIKVKGNWVTDNVFINF